MYLPLDSLVLSLMVCKYSLSCFLYKSVVGKLSYPVCMAEPVFLDLAAISDDEDVVPVPQIAPIPDAIPQVEEEPVPQVAEGGPGRGLEVAVLNVQATDWTDPALETTFVDVEAWIKKVFEGREQFKLFCRNIESHPAFPKLFKSPPGDIRILSILAHSAPYPQDMKSSGKTDPCQVMSFGGKNFVPFTMVAKYLKAASTKKVDKYDVVLLGCCHGDKFAPLIKSIMKDNSLLLYYGDNEEENDGVAAGNVAEMWETFFENLRDCVDRKGALDLKEIFETSFVEAGIPYLAPTGREKELEPNGDFRFCELVMDKSVNTAKKDPSFVPEYTYAGNLKAVLNGEHLVTAELKARRAQALAAKKAEIDAKPSDAKGKGKRRRE